MGLLHQLAQLGGLLRPVFHGHFAAVQADQGGVVEKDPTGVLGADVVHDGAHGEVPVFLHTFPEADAEQIGVGGEICSSAAPAGGPPPPGNIPCR